MNELALKYGCNLNQKPSRIYMEDGSDLPVTVLNGKRLPHQFFSDASTSSSWSRSWESRLWSARPQLPSSTFPAGAALGRPLTDVETQDVPHCPGYGAVAAGKCLCLHAVRPHVPSFGDWIVLRTSAMPTAKLIQHEVSDGIIALGYEPRHWAILSGKKRGNYNVVAIDPAYKPAPIEHKQVYGITFEQGRNELVINADTMLNNWVTENKDVTEEQKRDLVIALITLKYTQSNSVCYTYHGQTIGVAQGPAEPHPLHLSGRPEGRQTGSCATWIRCSTRPSATMWQSPTVTTPLMFISAIRPRM